MIEALESRWLPSLTFQFANSVGVNGSNSVDVESNSVVNDPAGNVYVTGSLQGTANFNPGPNVTNLSSTGSRDVFVARYSPTGALVWAKNLRGANSGSVAQGAAVAVDPSGNVFVTGSYTGTVNFDPNTVNAGATLTSPSGGNDVFLAKYDANGNFLWADDVSGTSGAIDEGYALAVDGSGNVAIAGSFQNSAKFGATTLTASGSFDNFVAKVNASGQFAWAKASSGSGSTVAQSAGLAFDASGNLIATGLFSGSVNFGTPASPLTLTSVGSTDVFIQKFDGSGNMLWAESIGSADVDQGASVVADASGNVYVTGTFAMTANFNPNPAGTPLNLTAGGFEDGFLVKLSSTGQFVWAKDLSVSPSYTAGRGEGVGLDALGHVFVAGYYQGTIQLDPTAANASLTSLGSFDVFVAEYDTSGNFLASQSAGGANFDSEVGVGVNSSGQVAIAGRYSGPATFGSSTLPAFSKSIFIAQLASASPTPPAAPGAPVLEAASDTGVSSTDGLTNATTLVLDENTVSASGNTVRLLRDGVVVGSRVGAGPITDPGPVPNGVHVYTAVQINAQGLVSTASSATTVTVNTKIPATPAAPLLLGADDSGVVGDGITNVKQPRITGSIDPNTIAQLLDSFGNVLASTPASSTGSYTLTVPAPLSDGPAPFRIREQDLAGNLSAASPGVNLVIDTTPPATPAAPVLLADDDSGIVGDGITNVKQPRITGTVAANTTVQLLDSFGDVLTSAQTGSTGSYTLTIPAALPDGPAPFRVRAVDVAGNLSVVSPGMNLVIDTTPPAAPSAPTLLAADDSGLLGDNITNVRQPRLTGTALAGSSVQLLNAQGSVIGSASVGSNGSYTLSPTSPLADGVYALRVADIDVAGNLSQPGLPLTLTILATQPVAPAVPALLAADDSGVVGDGITTIAQPHLVGTAPANATVRIITATGTLIGSGTAGASGAYSILPSTSFSAGIYLLEAQVIDVAGNIGTPSLPFTLTIQTPATPPSAPSTPVLLAADDSGTKGDGITNVNRPRFFGTATANTTVQLVSPNGTILGSAPTASNGSYTVALTSPLTDGTYTLLARDVDASGNISAPSSSATFTIDATPAAAPAAPSLLAADDSGVKGDGITNVNTPRIVGNAPANATVQLVNAAQTVLGTSTAASDGSYTLSTSPPFVDGTYSLSVEVVDVAGNVSAPSAPLSLTILTTVPTTPSAPTLLVSDDSGTLGDGITNVNLPHLTGTALAGSTVQLLNGSGAVIASTIASSSGLYTVQPTSALADGTATYHTRDLNAAGTASPLSAPLALTILTAQPAAPSAPTLSAADDTGPIGDGKTSVRRPRLVGSAPLGSAVDLLDASGNVLASTTVTAAGTYSLQPPANLNLGTYPLRVRLRDVAGNVGAASASLSLTIVDASPSDFDGDGKSDVGVYRLATSQWIGVNSAGGTFNTGFGDPTHGDVPVPADYDGLGHSEMAVYRPSTGQWIISGPTGVRIVSFGDPSQGDIAVPGDYDGVGHAELAVFRPTTDQWLIAGPNGLRVVQFGDPTQHDIPVPGDYDGTGHTEFAIFRPATAQWLIAGPNGLRVVQFGDYNLIDIPIPGDYDGLGRTEIAVFQPSTGRWIINGPTVRIFTFGEHNLTDVPIEAPLQALERIGVVGGIRLPAVGASAVIATPAALATGSVATPTVKAAAITATSTSTSKTNTPALVDSAISNLVAEAPPTSTTTRRVGFLNFLQDV